LQEYFRNHEITAGEWELLHSRMFPILDQYQKEGYQALMKVSGAYRGAFLCDGVGLGKTFIGMMTSYTLPFSLNQSRMLVYDTRVTRVPFCRKHGTARQRQTISYCPRRNSRDIT